MIDDTNTVIIDFTNNNNNNYNINSSITIDPSNIVSTTNERDRYENMDTFQAYQNTVFDDKEDIDTFEPNIKNITENPIRILDAIAKSQMQNVIFKFAEDIIGALGFKSINIFKSDRYDAVKKAVDNLSKIDPDQYIKGTSMIVNNTNGQPGGGLPTGPSTTASSSQSTGPQIRPPISSKINLSNIPPNIQTDLANTDALFHFNDSTEYLNNIIFLKNLQKDKLKRQKIFFDYHMEVYEKLHIFFSPRFTSPLNIILDLIKHSIKVQLNIEFEDNKEMFAELIKEDYYNTFVSFCRDYFRLNVLTFIKLSVNTERSLLSNLISGMHKILNLISNNITNETPSIAVDAQTSEFFNNL